MSTHSSSNLGKYESGNPVVQGLLDRFYGTLVDLVTSYEPTSILDVGAGEGMAAARLKAAGISLPYKGIDLDHGAVAYAQERHPELTFEQGSVLELSDRADLVMCLEVLEHLEDPAAALDQLYDAAERVLIVSVPWEPWFRLGNLARGKYLDRWGNHPEHIQQFNPSSIGALLRRRYPEVRVVTSFPWVFACAQRS